MQFSKLNPPSAVIIRSAISGPLNGIHGRYWNAIVVVVAIKQWTRWWVIHPTSNQGMLQFIFAVFVVFVQLPLKRAWILSASTKGYC
ncbi:hypothetical protein DFJ73DRAFT_773993 [Zopfochytrium polystomum]|nr:hypothetical protein DFJ73DRAFT_773993 [Zopfochytrium polystomum]